MCAFWRYSDRDRKEQRRKEEEETLRRRNMTEKEREAEDAYVIFIEATMWLNYLTLLII